MNNNSTKQKNFPLKKLLDIITKQHDAFKFQTGSFIDITYFSSAPSQYLKEIKLKMNEIYILSCKISKLLIESTKLSEIYLKHKTYDHSLEKADNHQNNSKIYQNIKLINNRIENEVRANYKKENKNASSTSLKLNKSINSKNVELSIKLKTDEIEQIPKKEVEFKKCTIEEINKSFQSDFMNINVSQNIFDDLYQKQSVEYKSEVDRSKLENSILKDIEFEPNKSSLFEDKFISVSKNSKDEKNSFFEKEHSFFKPKNSLEEIVQKEEAIQGNSYTDSDSNSDTFEDYSSQDENNPSSSNLSRLKRIKKKRGNYNICSKELKMEAIRISRIENSKVAADLLNIPEKNIKRWLKNGPDRKKGAGRKTMDPLMEQNLLNWIAEKYRKTNDLPDNKELKIQAKIFSSMDRFKASKGWCDKFLRRNNRFFQHLKEEQFR